MIYGGVFGYIWLKAVNFFNKRAQSYNVRQDSE